MSTVAPPSNSAAVERNGRRYTVIAEGLASILVPETATDPKEPGKKAPRNDESVQQVFYNPIQQFNRDLSVLAIKAFGEEALERKAQAEARRKEYKNPKKRKRQEPNGESSDRSRKVDRPSVADEGEDKRDDSDVVPDHEVAVPSQGNSVVNGDKDHAAGGISTTATQQEARATEERPSPNNFQLRILDALSASGLRALRYAHELPFPVTVTANDLLPSAVETIKLNVEHNNLADKITVTESDAKAHMYTTIGNNLAGSSRLPRPTSSYDVIDLDPYGSAAPFFDAAVQAVRAQGGLLCVTCTDAGVWASNGYQEKAFALYGGIPMKGPHSHEAGIRIILHGIAAAAARYGLAIEPLLSLSIDFYCRMFVRIKSSPAAVKFLAGNTMVVYNCDAGCGAWASQPLLRNVAMSTKSGSGTYFKHTAAQGPPTDAVCEHCGIKMHIAGPMYAGRMHSGLFIRRILDGLPQASTDIYKTTERIRGMLQTALEEIEEEAADETLDADKPTAPQDNVDPHPFFFMPQQLSKTLHCRTPSDNAVRGALRGLGYRVIRSHCKAGSIKTNAPWSVIWHVMREWVRQKAPVKEDQFQPGMPGYELLKLDQDPTQLNKDSDDFTDPSKSPSGPRALEVVFDEKLGREKASGQGKLVRYQLNPRENWGPMNKAKGR
jgi:tRNA (guanine26-N2/guanine27-N2)-dimethyltransferase